MFFDFLSQASVAELVVWSLFIGVMIGSVGMLYTKQLIGKFVRALLKSAANDPSNALSLEQLGFSKNYFVRHALRDGSVLRKMIWEVGDELSSDESGHVFATRTKKTDLNMARFYIDESNRYRADLRYSAKGTDLLVLLIAAVVFCVTAFAFLYLLIPYVLEPLINSLSL
jgi:hypothetical protein